jgi:hypothetical protein
VDDQEIVVRFLTGARNFSLSEVSKLAFMSPQSHTHWVLGARSPGVKEPWREADYIMISGFRRDVDEICAVLSRNVGKQLPHDAA